MSKVHPVATGNHAYRLEIAGLRAEIERLHNVLGDDKKEIERIRAVAIDRMREVERLKALRADDACDAEHLRAEVERMKLALYGDLDTADSRLAMVDRLRAENETLRAESALWESRTKDGAEIIMGNVKQIERLRAELREVQHATSIEMLATNHGKRGDIANEIATRALNGTAKG